MGTVDLRLTSLNEERVGLSKLQFMKWCKLMGWHLQEILIPT
jgi:hypothetical protein